MPRIPTTLLALLLVCSLAVARPHDAQVGIPDREPPSYEAFVQEFQLLTTHPFRQSDLDKFWRKYGDLLTSRSDTAQLLNSLTEQPQLPPFPLQKLRSEPFYKTTMDRLLHSSQQPERILAYATLGAVGDRSFDSDLLKAARQEKDASSRRWAGYSLLLLADPHTSELFDFVVANEDWSDPHMAKIYLQLDPQAVRQTACQKIVSQDPRSRIFAVQCLATATPDSKIESLVRQAIADWPDEQKGYAIYAMSELQLPQQRGLLEPLLGHKTLRRICLKSLAASPTAEDVALLDSLAGATGPVEEDYLDTYLESERPELVRKWLHWLRERPLPADYHIFVNSHPILASSDLLPEVQETLRASSNPEVLAELPRALRGRQDEVSIGLLVGLLGHSNATVRYWAADALEGCHAPQLVNQLPALIRAPERTSALTQLAIDNQVDSLRDVYLAYWIPAPSDDRDWRRSSLEYLVHFARPEDAPLFRKIAAEDEDVFTRRTAIEGLGNLRDSQSVDLILAALQREPANRANARTYLEALAKIGDQRCRSILQKYRDHQP